MDLLFGEPAVHWIVHIATSGPLPLALFPPGAFLLAGLLFALVQASNQRRKSQRANQRAD